MSNVWYASSGKWFKEEEESNFFNPSDYAWAVDIQNHWGGFKEEIQNLIADTDKKFTSNSYVGLTESDSWSSFTFLFWKVRTKKIRVKDKCPKFYEYLKNVPGLVSFSLSRLAPQTSIGEHRGDTNAVMRCHLGIEIPAGLPACGLRAGSNEQGWAEGKWLFFNDAFKHSAWNLTDKRRIVIIMDVIRPEFLYKERSICANIRARHVIIQLTSKVKFLKKLGIIFKAPAFAVIYLITYIIHNQNL